METNKTDLQLETLFEYILHLEAEERQLDRILLGARNCEATEHRAAQS
jgi:hypothetical protein